jgi:hypothetical protein
VNFLLRHPRTLAAVVFAGGVVRSAWVTLFPDLTDRQAVLDSHFHPFAVFAGEALPSTILSVAVFFVLVALTKRHSGASLAVAVPATPSNQRLTEKAAVAMSPELDRAISAVEKLGSLIEIYPNAILDESALPESKARMKVLLRVAMAAFRDDPARIELLRIAWLMLGHFQPGIGPTPLVPPTMNSARPIQTDADAWERWANLLDAATAEGQLNLHQADLYLKSFEGRQSAQ